jgi:hypothetical protein
MDILKSSTTSAAQSNTAAQRSRQPNLTTRMGDFAKPTQLQVEESAQRLAFQKQIHRRWHPGDVYAPHDLSGAEQYKWKTSRKTPQNDAFDALGVNPVNEYKVREQHMAAQTAPLTRPELHHAVRVHDRDGPHKALAGDGLAAKEPAQDCKGDTPRRGTWSDAQCAQASVGAEEELAGKI